jgi:hypothetical protein
VRLGLGALLALVALLFGGAGILLASGSAPPPQIDLPGAAILLLAVAAGALALGSLWAALRILRATVRHGPVLRLDPSCIVLRTRSGDVVLPWDDVTLSFGKYFLKIHAPRSRAVSAQPAALMKVVIPTSLVSGGARNSATRSAASGRTGSAKPASPSPARAAHAAGSAASASG